MAVEQPPSPTTVVVFEGMDVVVRTPHGDADVEIVAAPSDATISDLLRVVTGQAAPAAARVDGRAVSTSRQIADLDLVIGSLIDARPGIEADESSDPVDAPESEEPAPRPVS